MALKADRIHVDSQIDFFMNETASRGGIVVASTMASGAAMDNAVQLATYHAAPSGQTALGVLMCDMVNLDLTRQHMNWHKEEVQQGGKVTIWSKGTVVTDRVYPGQTPAAGNTAYVGHSGYISTSDFIGGNMVVGKFMSIKDADGYAKVSVNLP